MSKKIKKPTRKERLRRVISLLKFILTLDDEEIMRSTVESVIEMLEDEIDKS
jgi:cobalamin biosynthesis protein CobD/CbiB